jgi:hypothetical protein
MKNFKIIISFCFLVFFLSLFGNNVIRYIQDLIQELLGISFSEYVSWNSILFCRKLFHVGGFFVLYRILVQGINTYNALIVIILLAATDEVLQIFLKGRTASMVDFFLDVGLPIIYFLVSKRQK